MHLYPLYFQPIKVHQCKILATMPYRKRLLYLLTLVGVELVVIYDNVNDYSL